MIQLLEYEINKLIEFLKEGVKFLEGYEVNIRPGYRWSQTLAEFAHELRSACSPELICEFIRANNRELLVCNGK